MENEFPFDPKDSIVVIAPHPDDETLGVGGLIYEARLRQIPVSVIYFTSGDGNRVGTMQWSKRPLPRPHHYKAYAKLREQEAIRALSVLGIAAENSYFPAFPDQGLKQLSTPKYRKKLYRSPYTRATHTAGSIPHTGEALTDYVRAKLLQLSPTIILLPMTEDSHTDHRAAGKLIRQIARGLPYPTQLYAYPIHYRFFPKPRGINPNLPLNIPRHHPLASQWSTVGLSPAAVMAKSEAVECYASQLRIPLLDVLMRSLVRKNELLLPLK